MMTISTRWRHILLPSAIAASLALSGCASLAPAKLEAPVRIEHLPYPAMSSEQVAVYAACRLALGGNDRRRAAKGDAAVAAARKKCEDEFYRLDDWWPIYVKLWSVSEPATEAPAKKAQ